MADRALVGRTQELARLHVALVEVQSGFGRLVLIVGEAGIGKTHLARASLVEATAAGMSVGIGRAWQAAGAPAFYVWSAAFEAIGQPFKLKRALTADAETFAACERVAVHVRGLCGENPTAILLDDLQWAEIPALLAMKFLAQNMPERLLLIGTVRIPEQMQPPIGVLLHEIMREADVISLSGLALDDLQALPESRGLGREAVAAVHRATGGNPFFARELLIDSIARTAIAQRGDVVLPDGVRAVLARKLASLGANVEILECAALGPQPRLDPRDIARVLGCPKDSVDASFAVALESGLLARSAEGTIAFAHDLMRVAILDELSTQRRTELHSGWARVLEGSIDPNLAIRGAVHAVAAAPDSIDEQLRERAFHAGVLSLEQMSFDDAVSLLEFAASADERAGRESGAVQALATLSEAMTNAGDIDRGVHVAERALELARRSQDPHALARAALAMTKKRRLGVTDSSVIKLLGEALDAINALGPRARDVTLKCAVEARLASALQPFLDPPRALSLARGAIARARTTNDERLLARILHAARPAFRILDDLDERLEMDTEMLYLATKHGDRALAAQARESLCRIAMERGDAPAFDTNLQAFIELANETRHAQHELGALWLRTSRAAIRGEVETARDLIAQLEASRPRWSTLSAVVPNVDPVILSRAAIGFTVGDHDGYRALSETPNPPLVRSMFTLHAEVRCGRRKQATELYEQVVEHVLSRQAENYVLRAILANATIALDDRSRAAPLYKWMARYAGRHVVWSPYPLYDGSIDRLRAGLASLLGDQDAAAKHFGDAITAEEAFGATPFARRTRAERDASIGIERAATTASKIEECVRAASARWRLTRRTSQVLELLVQGLANATIAEMLGISTRAVELHVTKLLDCACVDGRAALISHVLVLVG